MRDKAVSREDLLKDIRKNPSFDLIIIGGGATGLWCALDATLRGLRTLLIEKEDFAGETSSRSTKLLHGGLRYLKQGDLSLVKEALYERDLLAKNAKDFVTKRHFLVPYYSQIDRLTYNIGLWLYDKLARKREENHRVLTKEEVLKLAPTIEKQGLIGGGLYYDLQFDDARFAIELAKQIWHAGGYALNYCSLQSFIKEDGKIKGIKALDEETGEAFTIHTKAVINAAGVFVDRIRALDNPEEPKILSYSRGSHIVLPARFLPKDIAIVVPKTKDKRIIFIIPWLGKVLVGTTDVKVESVVEDPSPSEEEIDFLLELAGQYLSVKPKREDILAQFAGLRPLVKKKSTQKTSKLSRTHKIFVGDSNLITIAGGKWTTARHMAEDTVDKVFSVIGEPKRACLTHTLCFRRDPPKSLQLLDAALPYTREDIKQAVEEEMALHVSDVLARRTRMLFLDKEKSLLLAPKVAALMASYKKKDSLWIQREVEAFYRYAKSYQSNRSAA
ncbi:MAG: glycerol-3-phosphate dehydrogenase/oxidase [Verrucomicrobia bacterium]|nr:glycerol-3-phosphate dehydrogenase/oxidase [Verrucomicrobiota bacterium]